jgi:protease I
MLAIIAVLALAGPLLARDSILVLVAERGFDDREHRAVTASLLARGIAVRTAALNTGAAIALNDSVVDVEVKLSQDCAAAYTGLILIGGVGSLLFWDDSLVLAVVRDFASRPGVTVGGIGLAPIALARSGAFTGRRATVSGDARAVKLLEQAGLRFRNREVVRDGNLVTCRSYESGTRFVREFLAARRS